MRMLLALCIGFLLNANGILLGSEFQESEKSTPAPANQFEKKPARSQFDIKEFHEFVSYNLGRPVSRGSLVPFGFVTRTLHGRVVDHEGKPIAGAKVAFVETIGYSGQCYNENFDLTDQQGRFLVEGQLERSRIVVRRDKKRVWTQAVTPEATSLDFAWPAPATCTVTVDPALNRNGDKIWISSSGYWAGMNTLQILAKLDPDGSCIVEDLLPGSYRIAIAKDVAQGEQVEPSRVEVGSFKITANVQKSVTCQRTGNRQLSGKVPGPDNTPLVLQAIRQKSSYIVPWLIEGLSDPHDYIRSRIVPVLGRVKAESALPHLQNARTDENPKTRMYAAFAIWQITGDKVPAVKALTVRLRSKNLEGQEEAVRLLEQMGDLPDITIKALVAKTKFDGKKDYRNAATTAKHGIKQAAIRTLLKIAPDALPENLKPPSK